MGSVLFLRSGFLLKQFTDHLIAHEAGFCDITLCTHTLWLQLPIHPSIHLNQSISQFTDQLGTHIARFAKSACASLGILPAVQSSVHLSLNQQSLHRSIHQSPLRQPAWPSGKALGW